MHHSEATFPRAAPAATEDRPTASRPTESHSCLRIVERASIGDRQAQGLFFDEFAPQLLRRLQGRYGSSPDLDTDDLLQDCFTFLLRSDGQALRRFLKALPPHKRTRPVVAAYLWDTACGIASNRRRSARRFRNAMVRHEPQTTKNLEQHSLAMDTIQRLSQCLRGAGSQVFLYFVLRYVEGLTPREVAEATGWPIDVTYRLKTSLGSALQDCKERLGL